MTECALCLDPIASTKPWGAVIGCGHPFHRGCWDRLIAHDRNSKCPLCNGEVQGFQPVYGVHLGRGKDGDDASDKRMTREKKLLNEIVLLLQGHFRRVGSQLASPTVKTVTSACCFC